MLSRSHLNLAARKLSLIVALALVLPLMGISGPETDRDIRSQVTQTRVPAPSYEISVGMDGEIYPAFANFASLRPARNRNWGIISVKITNSTSNWLRDRITVQIPGWSDQEIQIAELGAGESRTFLFAPTFLPRFYQNREIAAATAVISILAPSGQVVHSETVPVRLRSVDDLYWGKDFEYAPFIASWVTPHDPAVEEVLAKAKEFAPGRRLPGYEMKGAANEARSTRIQAKAIFMALQRAGVSYVKSSMTLGANEEFSERVRMPSESLSQVSANCIDGAVLYAAIFENLGMEPSIILMPGHAVVGVRLSRNSKRLLYVETSLTGRTSFERAVAAADRAIAKHPQSKLISISIRQARLDGIYPMPNSGSGLEGIRASADKTTNSDGY